MRLIDLSPRVDAGTPVWPGDRPFAVEPRFDIAGGDTVTVSTVTTTTHIGAHIDAPSHVSAGAAGIDATPLDACIGPCLVIDASELVDRGLSPHGFAPAEALRELIAATGAGSGCDADAADTVAGDADAAHGASGRAAGAGSAAEAAPAAERLLIRHRTAGPRVWNHEAPGVDPAFVRWFAGQGGRLLGIDLDSFDPEQSKALPAHRAGITGGVVLLEGLDLSAAPTGHGELFAPPLNWSGLDAAPVRAVLRVP